MSNELNYILVRFYEGCSTFLPVFDEHYDTYESLRQRSPFAFNCICMVATKVRDGGGKAYKSEILNNSNITQEDQV